MPLPELLGSLRRPPRSRAPIRRQHSRCLALEPLEGRALLTLAVDSVLQIGGPYQDIASEVATDSAGNVYVAGTFAGTVDFDPGPGVAEVSSAPPGIDPFLAKYDAAGALIWARMFDSPGAIGSGLNVTGVAADDAQDVYVAGYFSGTVDFDTNAVHEGDADIRTSVGGADAFVMKLDAADGGLAWVRVLARATSANDEANDVAVDGLGNVYITGGLATNTTTSARIFAAKLDAEGNLIWLSETQGSAAMGAGGRGIAVDGSGNVHVAGDFGGKVDFDPNPFRAVTIAAENSAFVWKLTPTGGLAWARHFQPNRSGHVHAADIAVDGDGNVYTTGDFEDYADFDPGKGTYRLTAVSGGTTQGIFVSKLDRNGNFAWARNLGGSGWDYGLALDPAADLVHVTGSFEGTADFDPGAGTHTLTSRGGRDAFVASLTMSSGTFAGVVQTGGAGDDRGLGLVVDPFGAIYAVGFFEATADFGSTTLTSRGNLDGFLVRLRRA